MLTGLDVCTEESAAASRSIAALWKEILEWLQTFSDVHNYQQEQENGAKNRSFFLAFFR